MDSSLLLALHNPIPILMTFFMFNWTIVCFCALVVLLVYLHYWMILSYCSWVGMLCCCLGWAWFGYVSHSSLFPSLFVFGQWCRVKLGSSSPVFYGMALCLSMPCYRPFRPFNCSNMIICIITQAAVRTYLLHLLIGLYRSSLGLLCCWC